MSSACCLTIAVNAWTKSKPVHKPMQRKIDRWKLTKTFTLCLGYLSRRFKPFFHFESILISGILSFSPLVSLSSLNADILIRFFYFLTTLEIFHSIWCGTNTFSDWLLSITNHHSRHQFKGQFENVPVIYVRNSNIYKLHHFSIDI